MTVMIKCECGASYDPTMYGDCPDCYEDEYDRYIYDMVARRILENKFREVTPPPSPSPQGYRVVIRRSVRRRQNPLR